MHYLSTLFFFGGGGGECLGGTVVTGDVLLMLGTDPYGCKFKSCWRHFHLILYFLCSGKLIIFSSANQKLGIYCIIVGFRHAYNISIKELTGLVVKAILEQPFSEDPSLVGREAIKILIEVWRLSLLTLKTTAVKLFISFGFPNKNILVCAQICGSPIFVHNLFSFILFHFQLNILKN